jgi:hypothetical protein
MIEMSGLYRYEEKIEMPRGGGVVVVIYIHTQ